MASSDFLQGLSLDFDTDCLYQKLQQLWTADPIRPPLFHLLLSQHSASSTPESSSRLYSRVFTSSFDLHQIVSGSVLSLFFSDTYNDAAEFTLCYGLLLCSSFSKGYSASAQPVTRKHCEPATWLSGNYQDWTFTS